MKRFNEKKFLGFLLIGVAAIALFSFIVMSLWNAILVPLLHISVINFWQSLGVLALSKILFGGFRGPWWGRHNYTHTYGKGMREKWQNMSPEEREKFKREWKDRCRNRKENVQQNSSQQNEITGVE
jgi:sugar phosphate permease